MCKRVWTIPISVGDGPFTVVDRGPDGDVPVEIIPRRVAAMAVVYRPAGGVHPRTFSSDTASIPVGRSPSRARAATG